ncbi:hypothetical protein ATPR_2690 [Acetobacter tropicalis NBRC 101654]|uniref:Uncharacterized protein n=1 Tax=Acetobacter tropicalis NBRC 101654 TaxID=749388 RepID=F7VH41_9PROT|nr:hypothetical protein ATPR_2690 [Acetobacter tropicalis NBRC 101654]
MMLEARPLWTGLVRVLRPYVFLFALQRAEIALKGLLSFA